MGASADLAFAHAARARLAQADNVQRAFGAEFAHHGAHFGGADFQSDDDGEELKHVFSCCVRGLAAFGVEGGTALASSKRAGMLLVTARSSVAMALLSFWPESKISVPAAQLLLEICQAKSDFAPLPGGDHQHLGRGDVDALRCRPNRPWANSQKADSELKRGLDLRQSMRRPACTSLALRPEMTGNWLVWLVRTVWCADADPAAA